jgi:hypothetical protein
MFSLMFNQQSGDGARAGTGGGMRAGHRVYFVGSPMGNATGGGKGGSGQPATSSRKKRFESLERVESFVGLSYVIVEAESETASGRRL